MSRVSASATDKLQFAVDSVAFYFIGSPCIIREQWPRVHYMFCVVILTASFSNGIFLAYLIS